MKVEVSIEKLNVRIPVVIGVLGGREVAKPIEVPCRRTLCSELESPRFQAEAEIKTVSDLLERDVVDREPTLRTPGQETFLTEPLACLAHRHPAGAVERRQLLFSQ